MFNIKTNLTHFTAKLML